MVTVTSRKLPFDEALEHAELRILESDMTQCIWCCDFFLSRGSFIMAFSDPKDRAIFDSMLISYRRSIEQKMIDQLELTSDLNEKHEYFWKKIANQHVAHPVNRMQEHFTTLRVTIDNSGSILEWGGLSAGASGVSGASLQDVESLKEISQKILEEYIPRRREELEKILNEKILNLTKEQVEKLPDGITTGTRGKEHLKQRRRKKVAN